jgi:hypothetical protein
VGKFIVDENKRVDICGNEKKRAEIRENEKKRVEIIC